VFPCVKVGNLNMRLAQVSVASAFNVQGGGPLVPVVTLQDRRVEVEVETSSSTRSDFRGMRGKVKFSR
jgi:hypothetical protein